MDQPSLGSNPKSVSVVKLHITAQRVTPQQGALVCGGSARMADRSEGAELTLTSGEGECERRVCDTEGEPWCHVAEPTGDVCLARLRARPQPLSMETLQGARDGLEQCGELGEELGSCLDLALERFCREPLCVQENARLLIRWDGGELEFIAGQGQCEISVSCSAGEPQYHITEKTWDVFVAWMNSHPEPLSIKTLERVQSTLESWGALGRWGALGKELNGCFGEAISQFSREPPCVQGNARLRLCWARGSLEFLSGEGQCEISVRCRDGRPQYKVGELPVHMYLVRLHAHPEPLSVDTLRRVRDKLGSCKGDRDDLRACFDRAWQGFRQEPRCVQENARLLIRWDGGSLEFLSGEGQCDISVCYRDGRPWYDIGELSMNKYLARLRTHPEPLSADSLRRVWDKLGSWSGDKDNLRACFQCAWDGFRQEPRCVQENARLLIRCNKWQFKFTSGKGECEISVRCGDGKPQYHVVKIPVHVYVAQLRACQPSLSADTLKRVLSELRPCHGDTGALRACFDRAWQGFSREPRCVQENARLLIQWGWGELEFVSGPGQCKISVLNADGEPQYHITELGGDRPVTWSHTSPESLSIEDLARVRDRLGCWGGLGEELSSCFGEAISQFSQEPPCVQGNARLRLCWARGSLEFLSGEGQCEISVRCRDGRPQYKVGELPVHMYLDRLHAHPEPLSADTLRRVRDKLGSCKGDRDDLRACLDRAWQGFRQEPRCVQENARLLIQCNKWQFKFTSGKGECEITVSYGDGKPQYHVVKIPVHVYVAQLRADRQSLSADTLQRVLSELGSCHGDTDALRACFLCAWQGFCQEPQCVQGNARLLIRWGGGKLEFVSGQGQCEISVLLANGEPQYHITELGGDRPVTWSHSSPEPLSVADLVRVWDRLRCWGALGEELSGCFVEAISQFSREPPFVQGNARMTLCWAGGSLEFLSGEGECEINVHYRHGTPRYDIGELPMHMYLARLRARPDPLSAETLRGVWDKLGSCKGNRNDLRTCFDRAWQGFCQEPRCVQENARLLIRGDRRKLKFVSGRGECEISVLLADGEPQYHITELGGDRPVTWSHASPEPLSVADLARVRDRLGDWGALGEELSGCFRVAISQFSSEPPCVQGNARLLIQWGGGELEFVSGQGQCEISVLLADGEPQYHITELGGDRPVTWSHASPEPLSVADLARVRDRLGRWGALGEGLSSCFGEAISQFSSEPPCVQGNVRMRLCWDRGSLEFLSGEGQYEIYVSYQEGNPCYHFHVESLPVHLYVARLRARKNPLSADSLFKFHTELGHCRGDTAVLRTCLHKAWEGFSQEPLCVLENARLLIQWGGGELEFISGQGENLITVCEDGKGRIQYTVKMSGWWPWIARLLP